MGLQQAGGGASRSSREAVKTHTLPEQPREGRRLSAWTDGRTDGQPQSENVRAHLESGRAGWVEAQEKAPGGLKRYLGFCIFANVWHQLHIHKYTLRH